VVPGVDGHDPESVTAAIEAARAETGRPTLICCRTVIGWGAPNKQGTEATHGAALGAEEVARTRENIGWPHAPFVIPAAIKSAGTPASAVPPWRPTGGSEWQPTRGVPGRARRAVAPDSR
jgi:transketolase